MKKYGGSGQGNASAAAAQPIKNGSSSEGKDDSGPTVTSPGGGWKRIGEAKDEDEEAPLLPSPVKPAVAAPELTTAPLNKLADEDFDMFSEDVDVADTSIVAEALKSNEGTDGHMVIGGREVTSLNTHTQLEEDVDDPEGYMKVMAVAMLPLFRLRPHTLPHPCVAFLAALPQTSGEPGYID